MMRPITFTLLCLLQTVCVSGRGRGYQNWDTYTPYPNNALNLLKNTTDILKNQAPKVFALLTLPDKDFFEHLHQTAVRNSYQTHLFHLDVKYMITDGLDLGCRQAKGGIKNSPDTPRIKDHSRSRWRGDKAFCRTHCTHAGRYCPDMSHEALKDKTTHDGQDLVMEVLRRMCLGKLLEEGFAHATFFDYIHDFSKESDCMKDGTDLNLCSKRILEHRLRDFNTGEGSPFAECVKEAEASTDTPNQMLEDSLDFTHDLKDYTVEDLPVMEFEGVKYTDMVRADHLQAMWCNHFKGDVKPVSCDFCHGCNNMKNCLWVLRCDGLEFDIDHYAEPKHVKPPETTTEKVKEDLQVVEEDVVEGTKILMAAGVAIGILGTALLWALVELKRRRAVAEVLDELPMEGGFKDSDNEVELHEVS